MFLCCGEALIDMLPRPLSGGGEGFMPVAGGAVFNTAIALGRLGESAGFFSNLSSDMFGEQLKEVLKASGVDTGLCGQSVQLTTLAFVKLDQGQARYTFFDENSAGRNLRTEDLPELPAAVKALHFGAISLIPEPCGSAFEALMERNRDKVLSLDPNIRPSFIDDEEKHRSRISRMIGMADIVKVSDEDLSWLAEGGDGDSQVEQWLADATRVVLITRGAEGVTAHTPDGSTHCAAEAVTVVDTIGAGDTFNAGFLAGLRRSNLLDKERLATARLDELVPALELAQKVAAITVSRPGADPPWQREIN